MVEHEASGSGSSDGPSGENQAPEVDDDLATAVALLDDGAPLVLMDGMVTTDGGHLVMTQYVDIGTRKLSSRPDVLVKAIESAYGLEHAADIQLSAPWRFRDYGETLIRDDQEGYARRETRTETPLQSLEEGNREQERALRLLGTDDITISGTGARSVETDTQSLTFGRSAWIYCTSIKPSGDQRAAWRATLPPKYDHESTIRQPRRFALALGEMFTDQHGAEGQHGHFSHGNGIRSLHAGQFVFHGPVWYTDDVVGFLEARQSDPLYVIYALFLKHSKFRDQREYRFVVHCHAPVEDETLLLRVSGNLRDTLSPPGNVQPVAFDRPDTSDGASPSKPVTTQTLQNRTMKRTRRETRKHTWTTRAGGKVVEEGIATRERAIAIETEVPPDVSPENAQGAKWGGPGTATITELIRHERRVAGEVVDRQTNSRTAVVHLDNAAEADGAFSLEERDEAAAKLKAAARPFERFPDLPRQSAETLGTLARLASTLEGDVEVQTMSACWNAIWAISNLYECYGDVIESVGIEGKEFVGITLREAAHAESRGTILVGPRGTFAYVLSRGEKQRIGYGGKEARLVFFPDEATQATFSEFGWTPTWQQGDTT